MAEEIASFEENEKMRKEKANHEVKSRDVTNIAWDEWDDWKKRD